MIKILLLLMFTMGEVFAIPALEIEREYTQPDQSAFVGTLKGDEYFSWVDLGAGLIAIYNAETKYFEYGVADATDLLVASGVPVKQEKHQSFVDSLLSNSSAQNGDYSSSVVEVKPVLTLISPVDNATVDIQPVSVGSLKKTINKARLDATPKPELILVD